MHSEGAARAFWFLAKDDDDNRMMLWVKGNLSSLRTGLEFAASVKLIEGEQGKTIETPYAAWNDEPVEMTAEDWWQQEQQKRTLRCLLGWLRVVDKLMLDALDREPSKECHHHGDRPRDREPTA
jgi:hypothetical protein